MGRILAEDLRTQGLAVMAFDLKLANPAQAPACQAHAQAHGVAPAANHATLAAQAELVISAVVDATGARYVEGAVMASVPPYRIKVPLLLGGAHAAAAKTCEKWPKPCAMPG